MTALFGLVCLCLLGVVGMTATPAADSLLTISQVCARVPGRFGAKRLHPSSVTRWILHGVPPKNGGERVKLRAERVGGRWMTTMNDLDAFFAALAGAADVVARPAVARQAAKAAEGRARRACELLANRGA